ncbi:MAG TPA: NAD(P)H-hydrate dehydratase, partial [Flavobacteriaceae bacterium]|nr:NAD(P)H-hydrate dehydratase [Flavobacteriaceae bacterium]
MKIFTAKQIYEADKATEAKQQISSIDLMERAADQVFQWLDQRLQGAQVTIHIFCGIGNNGGDGMALGRMLLNKGYSVKSYIVNYSEKRSKCFLINYGRYKNTTKDWPLMMKSEQDFPTLNPRDIIVDCIFGIGLNKPVDSWVKKLIMHINKVKAFVLSIDVPSGLFVDTPTPDKDAVIKATATLTFQAPKLVFFLPETNQFSETLEIIDIGLDEQYLAETPVEANLILKNEVKSMYLPRDKFSHKGNFGHTYIIGGSYGKIGAVSLAAKSALKSGAGKVTAYLPKCGYSIIQTSIPEAMVITDAGENSINDFSLPEDITHIGIGPGLGTEKETVKGFLSFLKKLKTAMVIDADALNILASNKKALSDVPPLSILTPHPGELERLIGKWENDFDKLQKTKSFSKKYDVIVVIKGAHTITVYKDHLFVNTTGNPGMATPGSGDVLTGLITGLIAQGYQPLIAA